MKNSMAIKGPATTAEIISLDVAARDYARRLELARALMRAKAQAEANSIALQLVSKAMKELGNA